MSFINTNLPGYFKEEYHLAKEQSAVKKAI